MLSSQNTFQRQCCNLNNNLKRYKSTHFLLKYSLCIITLINNQENLREVTVHYEKCYLSLEFK